jgi:peptidoglycan/xylan/chitin deacetylase (PgdA/CDA1 family)
MLKIAKRGALRTLGALGVLPRVRDSAWRRNHLLILCYHGISLEDEHEWDSQFYVSPEHFESRLQLLVQGGHEVLPLGVALDRWRANTLPERSVAITFDDGTSDFRHRAYPLLKKYGMPATVYLTTYYCENNWPVFKGFCSYVLWKGRGAVIDAAPIVGAAERWDLRTENGRKRALRSIVDFADRRQLTGREKTELAESVTYSLGLDYESLVSKRVFHLMTPSEVAELSGGGVDFQLHTHRHRTPADRALFEREIQENRERIRSLTGDDPAHFCYPSGIHNADMVSWLSEFNVISATTCDAGMVSPASHPLLLPRLIDTMQLSPIEFDGWLSGVASFLPRRSYSPKEAE